MRHVNSQLYFLFFFLSKHKALVIKFLLSTIQHVFNCFLFGAVTSSCRYSVDFCLRKYKVGEKNIRILLNYIYISRKSV